ncbi:unnamed protein product [Cuscuta campestris]|uniref:CCHC-type domain-containing protein n=1 Tax=Cuscuta campestris TaxID=132261 RepID=A0A484MNP8_9ASTE|nr:unnamed protein product [Cuscuta campestris]
MVNNMDHGLPKFSLLGYDDWKIMMEAHLYALHDCMWMVLEDGPLKIQMENPERNPAAPDVVQYIPKPKQPDCKKHNLDNWYTKATAMEGGRNLENYTVQGLLDELRTYEHELKKKKEEQVTPFPTALMTTPRIPSSEGTCTRNCDTPSSSQPTSSKMENYDEEFAMMVKQFRKFKKFFKKADSIRRPSKGKPQVSDSPPEFYLCYNCRKPGHWKSACPYPKVEKYGERERIEKKKKAMVAAESDESSSSSSDEEALVCMERRVEKSNHEDRWTMSEDNTLCLMAKDDADQEDEEVNEGDKMKPTEFIPFRSLPLKTSQRNLDSNSAEPTGNLGQPSNIPDHSNGDNSGNGNPVPIHPETPTTSALQPEAELDQPVNPNQHNLRWLRDHPPQQVIGDIQSSKLEAKCSSRTFYQSYLEMIDAQELYEFLHMEIRFKYENEVLEFYKNGKVKTVKSKKDPQRTIQVINSTVGGTKVKLSQKKLGEKLHLPNSGVEIGRLPAKNLDWNIIGISGQAPSGPAKKTHLNNDYKLVLELVIACLKCGSGGHADDITQERAFIINALITKSKSLGAASEGKKYEARYWLYYLSSKGENKAGASTTAEESSSDNVLIMSLNKSVKRKQVVSPSPSAEAPQNLAPINLEEEEEFSDQGELQRKKKRKIISPSTSGYVNPDELKEKEPTEESPAHNRSPQQLEEETPQLYYDWRAWKVGNSAEQLLNWDQQLKNEKIIKKCLGLPVNYCCEQILDVDWVWQRNYEDLHLEHLVTSPISEFEVDDEDPAVYKPVLSKTTEDQNQEGSNEELEQLLHSEALEILTNPCEITNPTDTEIPEKSAENLEMSKTPETNEAHEEQAVEAQRSSAEAEKETQKAELEASKSPVDIFEEQNEAEERDSLSRDISNFTLGEAEEESQRTLKINDEEDVQDDAESLPMQLFL